MGKRRMVLFPFPFKGHMNPMIHLATILHSKGISITILLTDHNHLHPSTYPHFSFISIPSLHPEKGTSSSSSSSIDALSMIPILNNNYAQSFKDSLSGLLLSDASTGEEKKLSCLVADPFWYIAHSVAVELNLPRLTLRTGGVAAAVAYAYFPLLLQQGFLPPLESEMDKEIPQISPLRVKDLPIIEVPNQEIYYECIQNLVENIKTSSGIILNTFEELEHAVISTSCQTFPIPHFPIGPFHLHLQPTPTPPPHDWTSVLTWLNQHPPRSVLYVSLGTLVNLTTSKFTEMAWGLCDSDVHFLWVVRTGLIEGWEGAEPPFPEGFKEKVGDRGKIVKWAVQLEVLSHEAVGGFCTHNGWNSTLESISAGVPMVCMPGGVDQLVNARYVSHCWKVGVQMEKGFEREEIKKVVLKVIVGKESGDMRGRAQVLKEKARLSVLPGGSSAQSLDELIEYIINL